MKFTEFQAAWQLAREDLQVYTGDDNFPGLGVYDRVYTLPDDAYGWPAVAIVRATRLVEALDERIPITVWVFNRSGHEAGLDDITAEQHLKLAEIKRSATQWIRGEIAELPPSTSKHWRTTK